MSITVITAPIERRLDRIPGRAGRRVGTSGTRTRRASRDPRSGASEPRRPHTHTPPACPNCTPRDERVAVGTHAVTRTRSRPPRGSAGAHHNPHTLAVGLLISLLHTSHMQCQSKMRTEITPLLVHMRASFERVMVRARDGLTRPPADPPDPLKRCRVEDGTEVSRDSPSAALGARSKNGRVGRSACRGKL